MEEEQNFSRRQSLVGMMQEYSATPEVMKIWRGRGFHLFGKLLQGDALSDAHLAILAEIKEANQGDLVVEANLTSFMEMSLKATEKELLEYHQRILAIITMLREGVPLTEKDKEILIIMQEQAKRDK